MTATDSHTSAAQLAERIEQALQRALIGQPQVVREVLVALLSGGHILLEGVPGLGKTLLVRALSQCLALQFRRIQFTPDLMPSDVTGHAMYDPKREQFHIRKGPAFSQLLLADEINRASAKTQAALLEVMQERQITIEGKCFSLPPPFMVLATQNPIDQEGTYPLPEAELDRFLLKSLIDYPDAADEAEIVQLVLSGAINEDLTVANMPVLADADGLRGMQQQVALITLDEAILDYALRLVRRTRDLRGLMRGAGPRASIALCRAARANALLCQRDFVIPDDIKRVAPAVLRHRIQLSADAEIDGQTPEKLLTALLDTEPAPRQ